MPKPSRGGKRSAPQSAFTFQNQAGTATPQQAQDVLQDLSNGDTVDYSNYMKLSDDEKADAIEQIMKNDLPNFLDNSATQKLLYYTDIEAKPQVVSDSALDKLPGNSLYRTVHDVYNRAQDVSYTAKQIYNQLSKGDFTAVSGSGGSAYGKGIYFASSYTDSTAYRSGVKNNITMRAKLNSNARTVSHDTAVRGVRNEISKGTKLGKQYSKMGMHDATSIWALNNGYNVVNDPYSGYHVILDRRAMTISTHTTDSSGRSWH